MELQASRDIPTAGDLSLNSAEFYLTIGEDEDIFLEVSDVGPYANLDELVDAFNLSITAASLEDRLVARVRENDDSITEDDQFVIALTPGEAARHETLAIAYSAGDALDAEAEGLGFYDGQLAVVESRHGIEGFVSAMNSLL